MSLLKTKSEQHEETYHFKNNQSDIEVSNYRQYMCAMLALMHYLSCGILTAFSSILITQLEEDKDSEIEISPEQASWIASIYVLPMAPASIITGLLILKVPKRYLLMVITLLELVGWLTIYVFATKSVTGILVGRLVIGISSAMGSPIIPSFLGEVTHPKVRGFFISSVFLGLSLGILIIHIMGAIFKWTTCIFISISFLLLFFALSCYLKESYVWHLKRNEVVQAKAAFHWYRGHGDEAKLEIARTIAKHGEHDYASKQTFADIARLCCSRQLLMPLFITTTLMVTMHLSGYKAIVFYSISIMKSVIPSLNKYAATIIVDVIRLVMTVIGSYLIKKLPIRRVLLISGFGSAFAHFLFAIFKYKATEQEQVYSILSLIALIMYIAFSTIGLASLPWVVCGELFPLAVKGIGCGASLFAYYVVFFVVIKCMPMLEVAFGLAGEFLFFGCCTTAGMVILYFTMPETKNKTLKEIEDYFRKD